MLRTILDAIEFSKAKRSRLSGAGGVAAFGLLAATLPGGCEAAEDLLNVLMGHGSLFLAGEAPAARSPSSGRASRRPDRVTEPPTMLGCRAVGMS